MAKSRREPHDPAVWSRAIARAQLGVWDWDLVADTCRYSDSWYAMLGYAPGELAEDSATWLRLVHPDDRELSIASGDEHLNGNAEHIETELRLRHRDGHYVWVLDRGGIVSRGLDGKPTRVMGVQTDISRQKAVEANLGETNTRFRLALEASQTGIWKFDVATETSMWDERTFAIFGLPYMSGQRPDIWVGTLHPDDRERAVAMHAVEMIARGARLIRYRIIRGDGAVRHVETLARLVAEIGSEGCVVGTIRDVTEEVEAQTALLTEKERYKVTLRSIRDAVISTDINNRVVFANAAAKALLGIPDRRIMGLDVAEVTAGLGAPQQRLAQGDDAQYRPLLTASGDTKIVRCTANPITDSGGAVLGTVHTFVDATAEQRRQRELEHAARHDPLTGLLNRTAFHDMLALWLRNAADQPFAVLYLDLDYFKALNDVAGHAAGDDALRAVASQIRFSVPPQGFAARLGGDEFAIIVPALSSQAIEELAQRLVTAIGSTRIEHRKGSHLLSASIGAAIIPVGVEPADALALADDACYAAKSKGRNRWASHAATTVQAPAGFTAARIVADLGEAKQDGRLQLYGQEIRSTRDPYTPARRIEVLARLRARDGTPIPPAAFIPAAERFGVAASIDRWVLRTALTQFSQHMKGPDGLVLGFNLSAQTLSDPLLWDFVAHTLEDSDVSPDRLVFEITETTAFTNVEAAERFVTLSRGAGCKVSLDDFGAGLSSFSYLRKFRVDSIKIDGSFIEHLTEGRFDRDIVAAITGLAQTLGYSVVAEKLEDQAALEILAELGVDYVQGYLLHRPEPLDALIARRFPGKRRSG